MEHNLKVGDKVKHYGLDIPPLKWWELAYLKPKWMWRDFCYWCKKQYQRVRYGFPLEESWDFKSHCAKWVLPRLKNLRKNSMSYPSTLSNNEHVFEDQKYFDFFEKLTDDSSSSHEYGAVKWAENLDKMIWSFEHLDDDVDPIYPENYDNSQIVVEVSEKGTKFKAADERKIDWSPIYEHNKRLQEGFNLFGKYYQDLWD